MRHQQDAKPFVVEMRLHASSGARAIDQHGNHPVGVEPNDPGGNGRSRFRAITPTAEGTAPLRTRDELSSVPQEKTADPPWRPTRFPPVVVFRAYGARLLSDGCHRVFLSQGWSF